MCRRGFSDLVLQSETVIRALGPKVVMPLISLGLAQAGRVKPANKSVLQRVKENLDTDRLPLKKGHFSQCTGPKLLPTPLSKACLEA